MSDTDSNPVRRALGTFASQNHCLCGCECERKNCAMCHPHGAPNVRQVAGEQNLGRDVTGRGSRRLAVDESPGEGRDTCQPDPGILWHEGPCIPHPDHTVDVPCAVCYACDYHVKAAEQRIIEWLRGEFPDGWYADNYVTVGHSQMLDMVAEGIEEGEHRAG